MTLATIDLAGQVYDLIEGATPDAESRATLWDAVRCRVDDLLAESARPYCGRCDSRECRHCTRDDRPELTARERNR